MSKKDTEFSKFIKILYKVCANSGSKSKFTRDTILAILWVPDNEINPVEEMSDSAFTKYYSGANDISQLAQKINAYLSTSNFVDYLLDFGGDCLKAIYDHMCDYNEDLAFFDFDETDFEINQKYAMKIANVLRDIFINSIDKKETDKNETFVEPTVITRNEDSYSESTEAKNQTLNMFQQFGNGNIQIGSVKKIVLNDGGFEFEE